MRQGLRLQCFGAGRRLQRAAAHRGQRNQTADEGRAASLAASELSPDQIVEELYLLVYSRLPDEAERAIGRDIFAAEGTSRRQATEDLLWALLNTPEFMFKD